MASTLRPLHQLARLYGIQTTYMDVLHKRRQASPETLLSILQALHAPVVRIEDAPQARRVRRQQLWQRLCEPVSVVWGGRPTLLECCLPVAVSEQSTVALSLALEDGAEVQWSTTLDRLPVMREAEVEGSRYVVRGLALPEAVPIGYHRLRLACAGKSAESLILAAPDKAFALPQKTWGVFAPLYALHSPHSWGGGDFTDLATLSEWVNGLGGSVVATLPLLTAFLDDDLFDPSPYAPVSRLFWNEFYTDVTRVPELERCAAARELLASTAVQEEIATLRSAALVDYRRQMALKRQVLTELSRCFFAEPTVERHDVFRHFLALHPQVEDYARFRAVRERLRTPWLQWPLALRDGLVTDDDGDDETRRMYLYAQWIAHEQIRALAKQAKTQGSGLYLDLPLGVHRDGYDVWRERDIFAVDASGGAPPDAVFTKGQDWGFPPLHPEAIREQGYRYVIAYLRHHCRQAGILRIDHVMGLHRLYWVPSGLDASQGAYVRYRADEMYALLSLESHRQETAVVGENLGTVPSVVNAGMARHAIRRMYVVQYELPAVVHRQLRAVPADTVASLNTHDMSPFAAFWHGLDIDDRFALGLMDEAGRERERRDLAIMHDALLAMLRQRGWLAPDAPGTPDAVGLPAILQACLAHLAASPARVVLVNLEDVYLETLPQNVPGTGQERPNWQRKIRDSLTTLCQDPQVINLLQRLHQLRMQRGKKR